jgi:hypothetical protein
MALSSFSVVMNALRLRRARLEPPSLRAVAKIVPNVTTGDQVRDLLGPPWETSHYARLPMGRVKDARLCRS